METYTLILLALGVTSLATLFWLAINAGRKHTLWGLLVLLLSPLGAFIYGIRHWERARFPFMAYSISFVSVISLGAYLLHASGTWEVINTSMHMHQAVKSKELTGRDAIVFTPVSLTQFAEIPPLERQQRRLQLMHDFVDRYESSFTSADRDEINLTISRLMYGTAVTEAQKQQLIELQRRVANKQMPVKQTGKPAVAENTSAKDILKKPSRRESTRQNHRLEFIPITASEARNYVGKMFKVTRRDGIEKQYRLIGTSPGALRFERRIPGGKYSFEYKHQDIEQLRILAQVSY